MESVLEAYIIYLAQRQKIPSGRWVRELAQVALLVTGVAGKKPILLFRYSEGFLFAYSLQSIKVCAIPP